MTTDDKKKENNNSQENLDEKTKENISEEELNMFKDIICDSDSDSNSDSYSDSDSEIKNGALIYDKEYNITEEYANALKWLKTLLKLVRNFTSSDVSVEPPLPEIFNSVCKIVNDEICGNCNSNKQAVFNFAEIIKESKYQDMIDHKYICKICKADKTAGCASKDKNFESKQIPINYTKCDKCKKNQAIRKYIDCNTQKEFIRCEKCIPDEKCTNEIFKVKNHDFIEKYSKLLHELKNTKDIGGGSTLYGYARTIDILLSGDNDDHSKRMLNDCELYQFFNTIRNNINDDLNNDNGRKIKFLLPNNDDVTYFISEMEHFKVNLIAKEDDIELFRININIEDDETDKDKKFLRLDIPKKLITYFKKSFEEILDVISLSGLNNNLEKITKEKKDLIKSSMNKKDINDKNKEIKKIKNMIEKIKNKKKSKIEWGFNFLIISDDYNIDINIKIADLVLNDDDEINIKNLVMTDHSEHYKKLIKKMTKHLKNLKKIKNEPLELLIPIFLNFIELIKQSDYDFLLKDKLDKKFIDLLNKSFKNFYMKHKEDYNAIQILLYKDDIPNEHKNQVREEMKRFFTDIFQIIIFNWTQTIVTLILKKSNEELYVTNLGDNVFFWRLLIPFIMDEFCKYFVEFSFRDYFLPIKNKKTSSNSDKTVLEDAIIVIESNKRILDSELIKSNLNELKLCKNNLKVPSSVLSGDVSVGKTSLLNTVLGKDLGFSRTGANTAIVFQYETKHTTNPKSDVKVLIAEEVMKYGDILEKTIERYLGLNNKYYKAYKNSVFIERSANKMEFTFKTRRSEQNEILITGTKFCKDFSEFLNNNIRSQKIDIRTELLIRSLSFPIIIKTETNMYINKKCLKCVTSDDIKIRLKEGSITRMYDLFGLTDEIINDRIIDAACTFLNNISTRILNVTTPTSQGSTKKDILDKRFRIIKDKTKTESIVITNKYDLEKDHTNIPKYPFMGIYLLPILEQMNFYERNDKSMKTEYKYWGGIKYVKIKNLTVDNIINNRDDDLMVRVNNDGDKTKDLDKYVNGQNSNNDDYIYIKITDLRDKYGFHSLYKLMDEIFINKDLYIINGTNNIVLKCLKVTKKYIEKECLQQNGEIKNTSNAEELNFNDFKNIFSENGKFSLPILDVNYDQNILKKYYNELHNSASLHWEMFPGLSLFYRDNSKEYDISFKFAKKFVNYMIKEEWLKPYKSFCKNFNKCLPGLNEFPQVFTDDTKEVLFDNIAKEWATNKKYTKLKPYSTRGNDFRTRFSRYFDKNKTNWNKWMNSQILNETFLDLCWIKIDEMWNREKKEIIKFLDGIRDMKDTYEKIIELINRIENSNINKTNSDDEYEKINESDIKNGVVESKDGR